MSELKTKINPQIGLIHWPVGEMLLTTVSDGYFETTLPDVIRNISPDAAAALQRKAHRNTTTRINHNMYLLTHPNGDYALIDVGMGEHWGRTMGHMNDALARLGVTPSDIKTIYLTHLHLDHCAGLTDLSGQRIFPEAEIVVHEKEVQFWLDDGNLSRAPADQKMWFKGARDALSPYRDCLRLINDNFVGNGISAVSLPGHTPGHTGYRIESGGEQIIIWGDIVHLPNIQAPVPEAGVVFDIDRHQAMLTRRKIFDEVSADNSRIAGMHTEFPGVGYVERVQGGYHIIPEYWVSMQ